MIPGNVYRNGDVFYTYNEDETERVIQSDHEHYYVPVDPMDLTSEQVCSRCTLPATQTA